MLFRSFVALLAGAVVIMLSDLEVLGTIAHDPIGGLGMGLGRVVGAYGSLLRGAFGDPAAFGKAAASGGNVALWAKALRPFTESVLASVPLMFVGLAVTIAFRTGIFNIGGEGQFMIGALGGSLAAIGLGSMGLPAPLPLIGVVVAGALAGAAWLPARSITLREEWNDTADEVAVGVPRTRKIVVEGVGLLETQLPEISLPQQAGIRQYADQPELSHEVTADGMKSRRSVGFAVIAQQPGEITLAGARVPWWNVTAQRWEVAELPERKLMVRPSADAVPAEPPAAPVATSVAAPPPARSVWPVVSVVLGLAWLATILLWWRSRAVGSGAREKPGTPPAPPPLRKVLRDLDSACAVNDADAARRALLAFAEARYGASGPRSLGALAAMLPEAIGREVLALEAHLYGAAPGEWDGDALRATVPELEKLDSTGQRRKDEPLLPLYR